ncbi:rhodanese-like domain-containing protein [Isachenkonia alkalipeptolytica]|uniref:Rhodanese-like domain-containing protein n=1 Tax=Isachenkonia alkalipeptolytica TaxID=2565777 RepID=A0AA43XJ97_9CLOT|nr:rhodanese-like domain-containing protein [Isachenkonia alkalipeptolytica]
MAKPIQESSSEEYVIDRDQPNIENYFEELPANDNLISPEELWGIVENDHQGYYILDIRREEDFLQGHIEGSDHIWWYDVGESLEELPEEKRIVVVCYTGQSSGQVVGILKAMGYDAYSLLDGMDRGWEAEGYPLVQ